VQAWVVSISSQQPNREFEHLHYVTADNALDAQVAGLTAYRDGRPRRTDRSEAVSVTVFARVIDGGAPDGR
jgi:hypothetical protein